MQDEETTHELTMRERGLIEGYDSARDDAEGVEYPPLDSANLPDDLREQLRRYVGDPDYMGAHLTGEAVYRAVHDDYDDDDAELLDALTPREHGLIEGYQWARAAVERYDAATVDAVLGVPLPAATGDDTTGLVDGFRRGIVAYMDEHVADDDERDDGEAMSEAQPLAWITAGNTKLWIVEVDDETEPGLRRFGFAPTSRPWQPGDPLLSLYILLDANGQPTTEGEVYDDLAEARRAVREAKHLDD